MAVADLRPPGVLIERFAVDTPADPARVDVPVFVVLAERGPIDQPTRVPSWPAFVTTFGGFVSGALGAYAVKGFFDNGGDACWIVRVAAGPASTTTIGAQPADRRSSVVAALDGLVVGAAATVSQGTIDRTHLVTAVDASTDTVTWDRPLHPALNLASAINIHAGAAAAIAAAVGPAGPCLDVEAASPGSWGNAVTVAIGPGRPAATTNRTDEPSDGSFTVVRSVVGFEPGTTVTVSQELLGVVTTLERVVTSWQPTSRTLWWDATLAPSIDPTAPLRIRSRRFTLTVAERGIVREVHSDLQAVAGGPRFVVDATATSPYMRVTAVTGVVPSTQVVRLRRGRDGIAAVTIDEVLGDLLAGPGPGDAAAGGAHGLATTVELDEPAAVAIPDLVAPSTPAVVWDRPDDAIDPCWPCQPPPAPPPPDDVEVVEGRNAFAADAVLAAQRALIEHCERVAERIALLDPFGGDGPLAVADIRSIAAQLPSTHAVLLAPWIDVIDPVVGAVGAGKRLPPSGHYAGLIARTDLAVGPWAAPANQPLAWAHGLAARFDDTAHALLNEAGVVAIRPVAALGPMPLGVRTLSSDPLWVFVTVRRMMIWLRRTLRHALAWTVFEPAGRELARAVTTAIDGLLADVWAAGGLAGDDAREAFFVHVADQGDVPPGQFVCTVGVALARPAEFVTVQVRRTDNRLELDEAPEPGSWP